MWLKLQLISNVTVKYLLVYLITVLKYLTDIDCYSANLQEYWYWDILIYILYYLTHLHVITMQASNYSTRLNNFCTILSSQFTGGWHRGNFVYFFTHKICFYKL